MRPVPLAEVTITYPLDEHGDQMIVNVLQAQVEEEISPTFVVRGMADASGVTHRVTVVEGPVTRAAKALHRHSTHQDLDAWTRLPEFDKNRWRAQAQVALDAAA